MVSSWLFAVTSALQPEPAPLVRQTLQHAERCGQRCGGPVVLAGLVLGLGLVELSSGVLGATSRFSLELLMLFVLQLVGAMLVSLIGMALLLPIWLEPRPIKPISILVSSAIVGALLQVILVASSAIGGVLASPRADLFAEVQEVLMGVHWSGLLRSVARAAFFLSVLCGWSQWRARQRQHHVSSRVRLSSDLMAEGLMLLLALKLIWIVALDPLHLSRAAQ